MLTHLTKLLNNISVSSIVIFEHVRISLKASPCLNTTSQTRVFIVWLLERSLKTTAHIWFITLPSQTQHDNSTNVTKAMQAAYCITSLNQVERWAQWCCNCADLQLQSRVWTEHDKGTISFYCYNHCQTVSTDK